MEPTRSQNITVSWRRSASGAVGWDLVVVAGAAGRAAFLVLGVPLRLRLLAGADFSPALSEVPHSPQNLRQRVLHSTTRTPIRERAATLAAKFHALGILKPTACAPHTASLLLWRSGARKTSAPLSGGHLLLMLVVRCTPSHTARRHRRPGVAPPL